MKFSGATWVAVIIAAVVFMSLNLFSWKPGVGGTRGGQPPGVELERYFGLPAQHQAELWRSNDVDLIMRILEVAPFYSPHGEMTLVYRNVGWRAVAVNLSFATISVALVGITVESQKRGKWNSRAVATGIAFALMLLLLYLIADKVAVYL